MKSKGKLSSSQKSKSKTKVLSSSGQAKISSFFHVQPSKLYTSSASSSNNILKGFKDAPAACNSSTDLASLECLPVIVKQGGSPVSDENCHSFVNQVDFSLNTPGCQLVNVASNLNDLTNNSLIIEDSQNVSANFENRDSDDVVCATPQQKKANKAQRKPFFSRRQSSPDCVPPTPDVTTTVKRLSSVMLSKSQLQCKLSPKNMSVTGDKLLFPLESNHKLSSLNKKRSPIAKSSKTSPVKRLAESRTGFSPNSKRVSEELDNFDFISGKSNFNSDCCTKANDSFSLLQTQLLSKCTKILALDGKTEHNNKEANWNDEQLTIEDSSQVVPSKRCVTDAINMDFRVEQQTPCNTTLSQLIQTPRSPIERVCSGLNNNFNTCAEYSIESLPSPLKDPFLNLVKHEDLGCALEFAITTHDCNIEENVKFTQEQEQALSSMKKTSAICKQENCLASAGTCNKSVQPEQDCIQHEVGREKADCILSSQEKCEADAIAEFMNAGDFDAEDLAFDIEKMSPFKQNKKSNTFSKISLSKFAEQLLNEGIGKSSYCALGDFGRHVVLSVCRDSYQNTLHLSLLSLTEKKKKMCHLQGMWAESVVQEDDIVHILFCQESAGEYTLTDTEGLLVVSPDVLVSGTSVVSGVFCRRKAVLNERFKGVDGGNQVMLVGTLVHQLFQEVVRRAVPPTPQELEQLVQQLVSQSWAVRDMYGLGLTEAVMRTEMKTFLPHVRTWGERYREGKGTRGRGWQGVVEGVQDIEENFWSPRFGLKGKVDLTLQVRDSRGSRVVPLELKTGRASFSAEHKGQVMLYSLMSRDRREDPRGGLLLYLRDGVMEEVPAGGLECQALLQLRNEMAYHLSAPPSRPQSSDDPLTLPALPPPLDSTRACSTCPHLVACCALQDRPPLPPHAMAALVPDTLGHLHPSALEFFRRWCLLLHLELSHGKRAAVRALWCQDAVDRERNGTSLCHLSLCGREQRGVGQWTHTFRRCVGGTPLAPTLPTSGLQATDMVVVSSERCIALATGVILSSDTYTVVVTLDRDLGSSSTGRVYHIDVCHYSSAYSHSFTGLARLMRDEPRAACVRRLLVDGVPGVVKAGLSRSEVSLGRRVLRPLNMEQQRAVLRCCMGQDYTLVHGYPGTGKSVCVVALVRLLVLLGQSVLLTSYTHSALDNVLLKLKPTGVDFLRLGRVSRIHPDLHDHADELLTNNITTVTELGDFYASKAVVASTCLGVGHVMFTKRHFDVCVVDEAAQVLLPACLSPLLLADKFVLVGDSQQLPPLLQSREARCLGGAESVFSVLERTGSSDCTASLTLQYRMNASIMRLANALVYDNRLKCATPEVASAALTLPRLETWRSPPHMSWLRAVVFPAPAVLMLDTGGGAPEQRSSQGVCNEREAEIVARILATLLMLGAAPDDVGVIAPYRGQVRLLGDTLGVRVLRHSEECDVLPLTALTAACRRVEVNTVDQYQGRDKRVIVYSCVRSGVSTAGKEDCAAPHENDILQDLRRLNVALTRAKHKLILVGDTSTLTAYGPFRKLLEALQPDEVVRLESEGTGGWAGLEGGGC